MHVNKSLKLLKKINSVFHTVMEDPESMSALEQELLKSYVIQFYDAIIDEEVETPVRQPDSVAKDKRSSQQAANDDSSLKAQEVRDSERPARTATPEPVAEPEVQVDQTEQVDAESKNQKEDLLASIFEEVRESRSNGHIGERLISDMKKSMGLNDKLMFANVLFGGNQSQLLETLEELNQASELSEVSDYLNSLATEHDWTNETKRNSVSQFINLVLRKFDSK